MHHITETNESREEHSKGFSPAVQCSFYLGVVLVGKLWVVDVGAGAAVVVVFVAVAVAVFGGFHVSAG